MLNDILTNFINENNSGNYHYISLLNIADFKRRNCYIGYLEGDKDIIRLNDIIQENVTIFKRVDGGEWAIFTDSNPLDKLQIIINDFHNYVYKNICLDFIGTLENGALFEVNIDKQNIKVYRSLRVIYSKITNLNNIESQIVTMKEIIDKHIAVVDIPFYFDNDIENIKINQYSVTSWKCIDYDIYKNIKAEKCYYCHSSNIELLDGDYFVSYGVCLNCGIEFKIVLTVFE